MFQQFAKILGASDLKLEISMGEKGGIMCVSIMPVNVKPGMETIRAIQVTGTPEELDAGFFGQIQETLVEVVHTYNNIKDVKKDVKKAQEAKGVKPTPTSTTDDDDDDGGEETPGSETPSTVAPAKPEGKKQEEKKPSKKEQASIDYQAKATALGNDLFSQPAAAPAEAPVETPVEPVVIPAREQINEPAPEPKTIEIKPEPVPAQPIQPVVPVSDDW